MTQPADKSPPIPLVTKPVDQGAVLHARIDQVMTAISNLADAVADGRAEVKDFRKDVCDHFEAVDGKVKDLNDWRKSTSDRVRGTSQENIQQDVAIAHVVTELGAVKADVASVKAETTVQTVLLTDIKAGAKKITENRLFQLLVLVATYYAVQFLAKHGIEVPK